MAEATGLLIFGTAGAAVIAVGIMLVRVMPPDQRAVRFLAIAFLLIGGVMLGTAVGRLL